MTRRQTCSLVVSIEPRPDTIPESNFQEFVADELDGFSAFMKNRRPGSPALNALERGILTAYLYYVATRKPAEAAESTPT